MVDVKEEPKKAPAQKLLVGIEDFLASLGPEVKLMSAAFAMEGKVARRFRDTENAYAERFEAFKTRPVT